jgi:hypothetical protein
MSDHIPDATKMVCPHCNSPARDDWPAEYRCKTVNLSGRITRSPVCFEDQIAQLRAKVKRLEEALAAGVALMRATDPFTLRPDDENDDGVSLWQMHADSRVNWDEPPTACEHIALYDAVLAFGRAVAQAKATP